MSNQSKVSYSFGEYLLETSERRLWKDDTLVPLTPKAFDTLVVLVSNKGRVVEKSVLLDKIWVDTFVEEGILAQNILTLRKTLGTLKDGRQLIETVPRTGYRFIPDVKEVVSDDEIVILERRIKTEITAEHKIFSDEDAVVINKSQTKIIPLKQTFFNRLKENKLLTSTLVLGSVLLLAGIIFSIRYASQPERFSSSKFNKIEVSKLTSEGNIFRAAVSPDGKYLAFVKARGDEQSIFVKHIENSATIEILPAKKQSIIGLTFSPDGNQIYFTNYEKDSPTPSLGHLYRMPMLGGMPKEILVDIDSPAAISPDGKQIAFIRFSVQPEESGLMIANIDGKDEKKVATRNITESFSSNGLSWSPDGKTIVCAGYVSGEVGKQMDVLLVDIKTGEQKSLSKENWLWVGQVDWLKDGSGIIFPAWNSRSGNASDEIWLVTTEGAAKQISSGINGIFSLNLTADSNSLIAIKSDRLTDFWSASAPDFKQTDKILQNRAEYNMSPPGVGFLSNDRIIFGSTFNGNLDIWTMNGDGTDKQQLTNDKAADFFPIASNDGQMIVFISNRSGRENLWRMKADGNKQEQITNEINVSSPNISPDKQIIYYLSLEEKTGKYFLRKVNPETGESVQITSYSTSLPRLSPNGEYIACYFPEKSTEGIKEDSTKLTILSAENGEVIKQFNAPYNRNRLSQIEWKGNQSLSYLTSNNGDTKLWEQPINGEKARLILDLPQTSIFRFAWSTDGTKLIYEKGETLNDAILVNSVK